MCESCGSSAGERHDSGCPFPGAIAATAAVLRLDRARSANPSEARATIALERVTRRALEAWLRCGETVGWLERQTEAA